MNFILRPWKMSDLENLVNYANNTAIARFMTNQFPYPYTREKGITFIQNCMSHNPTQIYAIVVDSVAAGGIGIHPQTDIQIKNAELGYWLAEPYWGKGIATRAVKEMITYGFETFDITRIFARPFGNNIASQRVLEKSGFVLEARIKDGFFKNGEYIDELIYAVRKGDFVEQ